MSAPAIQHVYDFAKLDRIPDGPTSAQVAPRRLLSGDTLETAKSSTTGAALFGSQIIFALVGQARGSGAKAHTHPNEQFNYIVQGTMLADIDGDRIFAPAGTLQHTPTLAVHTGVACPDEDLVFLAIKDTRHGVTGPPVDGKFDGPLYLPGFGKRAHEPRLTTAETIAQAERTHPAPHRTYVYPIAQPDMQIAGTPSAAVECSTLSSADGSGVCVRGEMLQVGMMRLATGGASNATRALSEEFAFVLAGTLQVEIDGIVHRVPERSAVHIPAGALYRTSAIDGRDAVFIRARSRQSDTFTPAR